MLLEEIGLNGKLAVGKLARFDIHVQRFHVDALIGLRIKIEIQMHEDFVTILFRGAFHH